MRVPLHEVELLEEFERLLRLFEVEGESSVSYRQVSSGVIRELRENHKLEILGNQQLEDIDK